MPKYVEEIIQAYIEKDLLKSPSSVISDDQSLFREKLLDLDQFIELTIFIDERFGIQIPGRLYGSSDFDTVRSISEFIWGIN
jgi:acyl carrier protein